MINVHNTFDPLKEIIIGDIDPEAIKLDDSRAQKRIEYIFGKTKDELLHFQEILEARNIKTHSAMSNFDCTTSLMTVFSVMNFLGR